MQFPGDSCRARSASILARVGEWLPNYLVNINSALAYYQDRLIALCVHISYACGLASRDAERAPEAEKALEAERARSAQREQRRRVPAFLDSQPRRIPLRPTADIVHDTSLESQLPA